MKNKLKLTICQAAFLFAVEGIATTAIATAQTNEAAETLEEDSTARLDTIVVNARKREESLQDVPLAVTAFDERALERTFADTVDELEKFVPNVELSDIAFSGQALGASIRGISFADLEKTYEPAIGFSIDGVFLATNTGAAIDTFDIESIEILRGPQGTLYGRNTVGGVINVTRTRPTGEAGLKVGGRLGNNGQEELLIVANAPRIGDALSSKFYYFTNKDETFSDNIDTGEPDKNADSKSYGAAFLLEEPTNRFEALLSVDIIDDDSNGPPLYGQSDPTQAFCALTLGIPGVSVSSDAAGCASQSIDIVEASGFDVHFRPVPYINAIDSTAVTLNMKYEINDNLNLTSITGWRESEEQLFVDNVAGPLTALEVGPGITVDVPIFVAHRNQDFDQFSQEIRLDGSIGENTDFVTGLYYLNSNYAIRGGDAPGGDDFGPNGPGFGTAFVFGAPAADFTAAQELNAFAVFGDMTYRFNDNWSFSGGLRYTTEEKDFDINFILPDLDAHNANETFNEWTGRAILQYAFNDDINVFGGWSRGYRSGGFNGRATIPEEIGPFDSEIVDSFEIGLRAELLDRKLRFNPTVFFAQYNDRQEPIITPSPLDPTVTATTIENAAKVEYFGAELETTYVASSELLLRATLGLLDADVKEFLAPDPASTAAIPPLIDISDGRLVTRAGEFNFSVGFDYQKPINNNWEFSLSGSHSYQDELSISQIPDPTGLDRHIIEEVHSTDLAATIATTFEDKPNVSITLFGKDIFDDDPGRLGAGLNAGVFWFGVGAPNRRYGVEASVEF